jgi:hypothetical protein
MWESFVEFFVWQPAHIWGISATFGVLSLAALATKIRYPLVRCLPLFIASLVWLAYGFWERAAVVQRWDIRVDLLFGWPFLFGGTAIAIVLSVRSAIRAVESNEGEESKRRRS